MDYRTATREEKLEELVHVYYGPAGPIVFLPLLGSVAVVTFLVKHWTWPAIALSVVLLGIVLLQVDSDGCRVHVTRDRIETRRVLTRRLVGRMRLNPPVRVTVEVEMVETGRQRELTPFDAVLVEAAGLRLKLTRDRNTHRIDELAQWVRDAVEKLQSPESDEPLAQPPT